MTRPAARSCPVSRRRVQPLLEVLEDRTVPAAFVVSNTADGVVTTAGQLPGSLRQAIFDANALGGADEITFNLAAGSTISLLAGQLNITDSVTITGPGASQLTISGNSTSRVFNVDDGNNASVSMVIIEGLTLTGGSVSGMGGGIYNNRENLTLRRSILSGNMADDGGGLFNDQGMVTVEDSTLSGNIAGNASADGGGGLFSVGGKLTVRGSTLSGNFTAVSGGGMRVEGDATVINSTISGNQADSNGGGIRAASGTLTLLNVTIVGNRANANDGSTGTGGGINSSGATVHLGNTLVADNDAFDTVLSATLNPDDIRGTVNSLGFNLIETLTGAAITGDTASNSTGVDPNLGPLQNNGGPTETHALPLGSRALDAGDNALAVNADNSPLTTDQRGAGFGRIANGRVDIGAFEASVSLVLVPLATERNFFVASEGLRENLFGGNEKWLMGDLNFFGNPWYFIEPFGDLFEWNGSAGLGGFRLVNVGSSGWENPELIVNAAARFPTSPAELQTADQARRFYRSSAGNFSFNLLGGGEKWIKGLVAAKSAANQNNPWYFILPNGSVFEWSGTPGMLTGTQVAAITPDVNIHEDPSLLYNAFQDMTVNSASFDAARHFFFDSSAGLVHNLDENSRGAEAKWFRGDTNSFGNPLYFVLPNGDLVEWNGTAAAAGNVLANLGANAWDNLERVVEDFQATFTPAEQQELIDLDREHSLFRASNDVDFSFNLLGAQEKRLRGATNAFGNPWYLLLPNGDLLEWNGTTTAAGNVLATLPVAVYADPLALADAYADGSVLNNVVKLDPFNANAGGPGDTLNLGGAQRTPQNPGPIAAEVRVDFPRVARLRAGAFDAHRRVLSFRLVFDRPVTGVRASDFQLLMNGRLAGRVLRVRGHGARYRVQVSVPGDAGLLWLRLRDDNSIRDALGRPLGGPALFDGTFLGPVLRVRPVFTGPFDVGLAVTQHR